MINKILEIVAPHHCCGCANTGSVLCMDCKNNITFDRSTICLLCLMPCKDDGLCEKCHTKVPYKRSWLVGRRQNELEQLIDLYKFERVKSAHKELVYLLDRVLPVLPSDTVIVPIPTIAKHIRQRGYDHTLLIADGLSKTRGLSCQSMLKRLTNTTQLGKSARERREQASHAFGVNSKVDSETVYLLVDDIFTTGATLKYAAKALIEAGANRVWVAVVARQIMG